MSTGNGMTAVGEQTDVAIIGGGMMGATLALLLARTLTDRRVCLLEQRSFEDSAFDGQSLPSFDARSTALAPTTVDVMERLGVWPAMQEGATAIRNIRVTDRGHVGQVHLEPKDNRGRALGHVVENRVLGRALMAAVKSAEAIELRAPAQVDRVQAIANGMRIHLADERVLQASLVIIADGAESPLRRQLGIGERVKHYQQCAIVANVGYDCSHSGVAYERFTNHGPLALLPLGGEQGRHSALVWTCREDEAEAILKLSDADFLQQLHTRFGYRLGMFRQVSPRVSYPLKLCVADEQVRSGLVVMGNAAHFLHPVGGQGFNLAVRDAESLAQVLKQAAPDSLGDLAVLLRYEQAQLGDQLRTIALSDSFNEIFRPTHKAWVGLRSLGMLTLELNDTVRSAFIRQMSGRAGKRVVSPETQNSENQ